MRNRFINLILGLIVAASPIVVSAASIGQSEMDVRRLHGKASSTIAVGSKKILVYPAGKVTLLDGKVVEISGDLDQKTPVRTESAASSAKSVKEKTTLSTKTSTPKHLAKFNNHLVDARGKPIKDPGLAEKDYVLVYYSASWCPPCRKFTPGLVNFYKKKKQGNNFELIFVSSDRSAKDT
ncbi:MAG: thioredoxin-like domain-containing protein, partial [Verrucomicrobiota bacterium]